MTRDSGDQLAPLFESVAAPDERGDATAARARPRPARRSTRSQGARARRRRIRRRRTAARALLVTVLLALAGGALWAGVDLLAEREGAPSEPAVPTAVEDADLDPQPTVVLVTFDEIEPAAGASAVTVLGWDRSSGQATVLLVPVTTVADIPGSGLLQLGRAWSFGDGPLVDVTLDNLLGLDLDQVVGVSQQAWASLFGRIGPLEVDVPERLVERQPDGTAVVRFSPGPQVLDGPRLAELLTFRQSGEPELEALPRTQLVLGALLDALAADPEALDAIFADGAPMLDITSDVEAVREILDALAAARAAGDLVVRTMPVSPIGSGDETSYRLDQDRATSLMAERFAGSRPETTGDAGAGRDLEIRNGNGVPGVGQQVAERLLPLGYRVVLTGNADRFDHRETRILVYRDDPAQLAVGREIRAALGVGRVELSQVPQTVADVTIIVGQDFPADG